MLIRDSNDYSVRPLGAAQHALLLNRGGSDRAPTEPSVAVSEVCHAESTEKSVRDGARTRSHVVEF